MIDISKIRPGDEVTVRAKATHTAQKPDMVHVAFENGGYLWVIAEMIDMHIPAPREIKVGDLVRHEDFMRPLIVRAVDDGKAWLRDGNAGSYVTRAAEDLTHAEDDDGR